LEVFSSAPSDGCASTTSLRGTNTTLVIMSHVLHFEGSRRCNLGGQTAPPRQLDWPRQSDRPSSSSLQPRFCGSTEQPSGFVVNHCKPRELGVASRQSPIMTRLPRHSSSTVILRFNQEIVHDFVLLFLPPCGPHLTPSATGSLEPSLLVHSTPGGPLTQTFRPCSSPAPTPIKLQPTPAILSQESVHSTLSITHHTGK
jgi:hypothetical protein